MARKHRTAQDTLADGSCCQWDLYALLHAILDLTDLAKEIVTRLDNLEKRVYTIALAIEGMAEAQGRYVYAMKPYMREWKASNQGGKDDARSSEGVSDTKS